MKKEFYKTPTAIGAALVIIGFLLPWISLGPFGSMSGYDIPKVAEMLSGLRKSMKGGGSSGTQLYYILYLIPVLAIYLIYGEYKNIKKYFIPAKIIIFLLCGFVIYKLTATGKGNIFDKAGIGLWVSVGGSIYLLIQAIREFQKPSTTNDASGKAQKVVQETAQVISSSKKIVEQAAMQATAQVKKKILTPKVLKISIGVVIIIILSATSYFILHKNSYQNVISAVENHNWHEVNYNYEKAQSEIAEGSLRLDNDENKKLQMAQSIANTILQIQNMINKTKENFKSINLNNYQEVGTAYSSSPNIQSAMKQLAEAKVVGFDIVSIFRPTMLSADSLTLFYLNSYLSDNLITDVQKGNLELDFGSFKNNINKMLGEIVDKNENKQQITSVNAKLKKLEEASQVGINKKQATTHKTNSPEPLKEFIGTWKGTIGKKDLILVIESVKGDSIWGYDVVEKNKRSVKGISMADDDVYTFELHEPGDDKWDGVFTIKVENDFKYNGNGEWRANNGKLNHPVSIKLQK